MFLRKWFIAIVRTRVTDLSFGVLLILFQLGFNTNIQVMMQILLFRFERYFFNQFLSIKKVPFELALRPIPPASFLMLNNIISFLLINAIFMSLIFVGHADFVVEAGRLNIVLVVLLAAGNFFSNTQLVFRYNFLGIPLVRLFLFGLFVGLGLAIFHLVNLLNSFSLYVVIFLMLLLVQFWSMQSQRMLRYKYQLILMDLQQNA